MEKQHLEKIPKEIEKCQKPISSFNLKIQLIPKT